MVMQESTKVLLLSTNDTGGAGLYYLGIVEMLRKKGMDATMVDEPEWTEWSLLYTPPRGA